MYATATGRLVSHLSLQTGGGPDQQAVLASNGRTVYFAQPTGTCGGVIDTVPISGGTRAMTVIDEPGTLALEPEASPTSAELAWVGVTCEPGGTASTLYVTNVATGQLSDLGPYTGQGNDDGLSWSDDGTLLAVEAAPAIRILPIHDSTGTARYESPTRRAARLHSPRSRVHVCAAPDCCRAHLHVCFWTKGIECGARVRLGDGSTSRYRRVRANGPDVRIPFCRPDRPRARRPGRAVRPRRDSTGCQWAPRSHQSVDTNWSPVVRKPSR